MPCDAPTAEVAVELAADGSVAAVRDTEVAPMIAPMMPSTILELELRCGDEAREGEGINHCGC